MDQLANDILSLRRDQEMDGEGLEMKMEVKDEAEADDDDDEEGDCLLNIADEVTSLSVHTKAINTSYINLGRHNPLPPGRDQMNMKLMKQAIDQRDMITHNCPEITSTQLK